jgi:hypothetical protein
MTLSVATLFAQPVLLDRQKHRQLRLRGADDRSASATLNAVFCAAAEFAEACKVFPLLFVRTGDVGADGRPVISPVCLMGLEPGENLFVDGGRWTAPYVPAFVRRHPFALVDTPDAEGTASQAVAVDAAFPGLAEDGDGERFFTDAGEPSPFLARTLAFLNDFERAAQLTRPVGAHLHSLGLLKEMRAAGQLAGGAPFSVDGFLVVDEEKLAALPDAVVLQMFRGGLMAMVHAHLVSLGNLAALVERKSARQARAPKPRA